MLDKHTDVPQDVPQDIQRDVQLYEHNGGHTERCIDIASESSACLA